MQGGHQGGCFRDGCIHSWKYDTKLTIVICKGDGRLYDVLTRSYWRKEGTRLLGIVKINNEGSIEFFSTQNKQVSKVCNLNYLGTITKLPVRMIYVSI